MPAWARNDDNLLTSTGTTTVRDITLDGNLAARGAYEDYEQEQSALLEATSGTLTAERVTLLNSPGDGITIRDGVTAVLTDIDATDCFRGGITLTGDNIDVTVVRYTGGGSIAPAYFQMESVNQVDPENMNLALSDSTMPVLQIEAPAGSVIAVNDSTVTAGLSVWAPGGGSVTFTDCDIVMIDATSLNEVRHYVDVTFVRCNFSGARLYLVPETVDYAPAVQRLTFEDCTFTGSGPVAIFNAGADLGTEDHLVTFVGTNTYSGFAAGYAVDPGRWGPTSGSMTPA